MKAKIARCIKLPAMVFLCSTVLSFCITPACFSQADSNRLKKQQQEYIKKAEAAQKQAMEQLKQMGITVDPNKKMTKEELQKMKEQLLNKARQLQQQVKQVQPQVKKIQPVTYKIKEAVTQESVLAIAARFYKRSYPKLTAAEKSRFNQDMKEPEKDRFSFEAVRKLTSSGGALITFGNEHYIAGVYVTAAVKAMPADTLCMNNFGAYLRAIDSVAAAVPVLLYANKLFSKSPVILTQLGNSYFELHDLDKAASFYKEALKYNPGFGAAQTALCDVYIQQGRLKDALIALFAGVKNLGCTYSNASGKFNYLQQQAAIADTKEDFWNETGSQVKPEDALAPLVPENNRIEMPVFPKSANHPDWMEGGGYSNAVKAYTAFHENIVQFTKEFGEIHKEVPALPANAVLRDYPNERFAIDCILEYFQHQSAGEAKKFAEKMDKMRDKMAAYGDVYIKKHNANVQAYLSCTKGCGSDDICLKECFRKYCLTDCQAVNTYNQQLQGVYTEYLTAFSKLREEQQKFLDDLYAFTDQWYCRIEGGYWSRIYAWEIRSVALSVIGNCFGVYPQPFLFPAHNDCGSDCSVFLNPAPPPPDKTENKNPAGKECGLPGKMKFSLLVCEMGVDCETVEFGCTAGVSASVKRNFVKKTTTGFLGMGVKGDAGFIGAGAKAGFEVTVTDNNEVSDVGMKTELSVSTGWGPAKAGLSASGSFTVMTGLSSKISAGTGVKLN